MERKNSLGFENDDEWQEIGVQYSSSTGQLEKDATDKLFPAEYQSQHEATSNESDIESEEEEDDASEHDIEENEEGGSSLNGSVQDDEELGCSDVGICENETSCCNGMVGSNCMEQEPEPSVDDIQSNSACSEHIDDTCCSDTVRNFANAIILQAKFVPQSVGKCLDEFENKLPKHLKVLNRNESSLSIGYMSPSKKYVFICFGECEMKNNENTLLLFTKEHFEQHLGLCEATSSLASSDNNPKSFNTLKYYVASAVGQNRQLLGFEHEGEVLDRILPSKNRRMDLYNVLFGFFIFQTLLLAFAAESSRMQQCNSGFQNCKASYERNACFEVLCGVLFGYSVVLSCCKRTIKHVLFASTVLIVVGCLSPGAPFGLNSYHPLNRNTAKPCECAMGHVPTEPRIPKSCPKQQECVNECPTTKNDCSDVESLLNSSREDFKQELKYHSNCKNELLECNGNTREYSSTISRLAELNRNLKIRLEDALEICGSWCIELKD